jgi:hypothetical protein
VSSTPAIVAATAKALEWSTQHGLKCNACVVDENPRLPDSSLVEQNQRPLADLAIGQGILQQQTDLSIEARPQTRQTE